MNNEMKKDLVEFAEYKEKCKAEIIFNFGVYTATLGLLILSGNTVPYFIEHINTYLTTVGICFGTGYTIFGYGLYNTMKHYKSYFYDEYGIDIVKYDFSKENIDRLRRELECEMEPVIKIEPVTKKSPSNSEVLPAIFKFTGYENHKENTTGKKLRKGKK